MARMFVRSSAMEQGDKVDMQGRKVTLDEAERKVLTGRKYQCQTVAEDRQIASVVMRLHLKHNFTDAWATDGSLHEGYEEGVWRKRVAWGAYKGMQPLPPEERMGWEDQETPTELELRRVSAGMRGGRLPPTCETVDAELCMPSFRCCARRRSKRTQRTAGW